MSNDKHKNSTTLYPFCITVATLVHSLTIPEGACRKAPSNERKTCIFFSIPSVFECYRKALKQLCGSTIFKPHCALAKQFPKANDRVRLMSKGVSSTGLNSRTAWHRTSGRLGGDEEHQMKEREKDAFRATNATRAATEYVYDYLKTGPGFDYVNTKTTST